MPKPLVLTREEFETIIKNYEATGRDVTELKRILAEAYPPKPAFKTPVMRIIYGEKAPIELPEVLRNRLKAEGLQDPYWHNVKELQKMCLARGLPTTGNKDALVIRLFGLN